MSRAHVTCRWVLITNISNSASAAVVVRFAYVKDFKNPDFLCE